MKSSAIALVAASLAAGTSLSAAAAEKPVSIVLVHGAFVDASGWQKVYGSLTKEGYEVIVVQNPTVTLADDVAVTKRAIAEAKHPVILVGHSYGGAVITEAGNDPKVRDLVYIAAYAPDAGETVAKIASKVVPGEPGAPVTQPKDGFLFVEPTKFPAAFAGDVEPGLTHFMAAAQVPWGVDAVGGVIASPAWKTKPTYFLITKNDRMIPPTTLREMAKRADAKKVVEVSSSHAVMLSHPADVVSLIETAAGAAQ